MRTFVVVMFGATLMLSAFANWATTTASDASAAPIVQAGAGRS